MKQKAHAWCALRALKLLDDTALAPELVELLCFYLSDAWEGAWLPDTLLADMSYGHVCKMESDPAHHCVGQGELSRHLVPYELLKAKLGAKRLTLEFIRDAEVLKAPYCSHPDHGGHLPDRVSALTHSISDMLKMGDYPLAFYARKKLPGAYVKDLSAQSVKDLSISPNFSGRQIALTFFLLSHYVVDGHMPLHCDLRDYGGETDPGRRLPHSLHASLEDEWEKHFPDKSLLALHQTTRASLDDAVKALPQDSVIRLDTEAAYFPGTRLSLPFVDEWQWMMYICRTSYALSRFWIDKPYPSAAALIADKGPAEFSRVTNLIFHDAVLSPASLWYKAWKKFTG
jgi:hypothetical protein